jgi:D123
MSFPHQTAQTFLEKWPKAIRKLAPAVTSLKLSFSDMLSLGSYSRYFRSQMGIGCGLPMSDEFAGQVSSAVAAFPEGVMPRIGYCSWRDSTLLNRPARSARDVMAIISRDDERIGRAMVVHAQSGDDVYLHLRSWREILPQSEFRLFIWKRRIVGASQYYHAETYPDIEANCEPIYVAIMGFAQAFCDVVHIEDVVADVEVELTGSTNKAILIELNPIGARTDPCLFDWNKRSDFDAGLRFRNSLGQVVSVRSASGA